MAQVHWAGHSPSELFPWSIARCSTEQGKSFSATTGWRKLQYGAQNPLRNMVEKKGWEVLFE